MARMNTWIAVDADSDFPLENIPFGVGTRAGDDGGARCLTRIGDTCVSLHALAAQGMLKVGGATGDATVFAHATLNAFMALGRDEWRSVRAQLQALFAADCATLRDDKAAQAAVLAPVAEVTMALPATIGDYTDFYSSREHATNMSIMFRNNTELLPNWLHIPIGYHGRASSVVVSGTPVRRPNGQVRPDPAAPPTVAPCRILDYELELGVFVGGPGNALGDPVAVGDAEAAIFGIVLLNDWSARDIQKWEYQPLGPFCGKNFGTTISPWIVTLDALAPFRCAAPPQGVNGEPAPLPYLVDGGADAAPAAIDIKLSASMKSAACKSYTNICTTNFKYMYWTMKQQLAHHTSTGCNMVAGDLFGSGTLSGPDEAGRASLLERSWKGTQKFKLECGEERAFLADGDTLVMHGHCEGNGYRVGFGKEGCIGTILPAHKLQ